MAAFALENDAFKSYLACGTITVLKMLLVGPMTSYQRRKNMAWVNPEDARARGKEPKANDDVERVKRCHLNDLENIPAFLALGAMYLATDPSTTTAIWHFRIFAIARILHTISYMNEKRRARGLCYVVNTIVNVSMAVQILSAVF
ncbi:microsomal glutathione S-transferase 1-like [Glandiceps talaboti]